MILHCLVLVYLKNSESTIMAGRKPNTYFKFKQFTIFQDRCAMKVGTDGVLLGAWVQPGKAERILDAGTGTGLLALMLAQKCKALVDAVEIDPIAAFQAEENVALSPWKERIQVFPVALQEFVKTINQSYQLVVSNPPYFARSFKPAHESRTLARHNETMSFETLLIHSETLLSQDGKLALVLPFAEGEKCLAEAMGYGLHCCRKLVVYPKPEIAPIRMLLELSHEAVRCQEAELVIETGSRHAWSDAYKTLTRDYYLNF
jgi:tRNA1Val (adenine37-N6)-methyltransferase